MKKFPLLIIAMAIIIGPMFVRAQGVAINTNGDDAASSSMLDITSSSKGVLVPRMDKSARDGISSPATGLLIYQTDNTPGFYFYSGSAWVVVGAEAMDINDLSDGSSDANSVFLGSGSGANDDGTSNQNTGVGIQALNAVTEGYENTGIGKESLQTLTTGDHNAAFGIHALQALITGNDNTAFGTNAGIATTGSGNILIGSNAAYFATSISNQLYIENSASTSPLIYGEFDNDKVRINGTFEVSSTLKIEGGSPGANKVLTSDASGNASWETPASAGVASDESGLKIIRGTVDDDGTIAAGSGFSVNRTAAGYFTITFTSAFSGTCSVTASIRHHEDPLASSYVFYLNSISSSTFKYECIDYYTGDGVDLSGFTFIAIGPQ